MKGIVYVGHGSRLQEGNEQFIQFIQSVMKERNERIQKIAFSRTNDTYYFGCSYRNDNRGSN